MKSNYRNILKIVIICCSLTNYKGDEAFLYTEGFLFLVRWNCSGLTAYNQEEVI